MVEDLGPEIVQRPRRGLVRVGAFSWASIIASKAELLPLAMGLASPMVTRSGRRVAVVYTAGVGLSP